MSEGEAPTGRRRLFRERGPGHEHSPVTYIELFFDLVFVFAITQLSHRLLVHLSLAGLAETAILFLAVWWAWVYTSWTTNWLDPDRGPVRLMLIGLMLAALAMAVAIPQAFAGGGLLFVGAYLVIQLTRTAYMGWAFAGVHRDGARNFLRIGAYFLMAAPLWLVGAALDGPARMAAWAAALAIEYAGPLLYFRFPLLGRSANADWDISGGHMAERCALFIIIALGEAILVTGATFTGLDRDPPTTAAFVNSFVGSAAMWWIYFDSGAKRATSVIEASDKAGLIARNTYTYLHIPIVAAIVVTAVGDELLLAHPVGHATPAFLATAIGGPWLFLLGAMGFKWSTWGRAYPPLSHGIGSALLVALAIWAATTHPQPLAVGMLATGALVVTAAWEWFALNVGIGALRRRA